MRLAADRCCKIPIALIGPQVHQFSGIVNGWSKELNSVPLVVPEQEAAHFHFFVVKHSGFNAALLQECGHRIEVLLPDNHSRLPPISFCLNCEPHEVGAGF
jgi:hypothetical protein